jgi:hypothetical protein
MRHLRPDDFVDVLDGELASAARRHIESCEGCRHRFEALLETMAQASQAGVPEPSPLFWQHFSKNVSDAIAQDTPAHSAWIEWLRHPATGLATLAIFVTIVVSASVWRSTPRLPRDVRESAPTTTSRQLAEVAMESDGAGQQDLEEDEAWGLVRTVADDAGWDATRAAGLSPRPGSVDRMALEMTAEERRELARLLEDELKRNGA